jgi:hypothetical protein
MTYHAGIGPRLGPERDPHVTCDGPGCTASVSCLTNEGNPRAWMLKRNAPPGWLLIRVDEPFSRQDFCASCKATRAGKAG